MACNAASNVLRDFEGIFYGPFLQGSNRFQIPHNIWIFAPKLAKRCLLKCWLLDVKYSNCDSLDSR